MSENESTVTFSGIRRVGVVGSGAMGAGIAELAAVKGLDVIVAVSRRSSLRYGPERIRASLDKAVSRGKRTEAERDAALARITFTADIEDLADRQFVIEAVAEDEALKADLFAALDKTVADPEAILASNTSSIPITKLARATSRPGRVVGVHFFNPVPVLPLVELIRSVLTEPSTYDRAERFARDVLGKTPVEAADRTGFIVNGLLVPYLLAAIRLVEGGHAEADTVDRGMELGCSHPMGPLRLADLLGLDIVASVADAMYEEFKEPLYAPPPLLSRMVEAGLLGRKTGHGFYDYAR